MNSDIQNIQQLKINSTQLLGLIDFYFINFDFKMLKPHRRSSSSLHIEKMHQRQIIREIQQNSSKFSSEHITHQISKCLQDKQEISRSVESILNSSKIQIKGLLKSRFHPNDKYKSSKSLQSTHCANSPQLRRYDRQRANHLRTESDDCPVLNQLDQIASIKIQFTGGKERKYKNYTFANVEKERQNNCIKFGDNRIVNRCWNLLQPRFSKQALIKIRQNRVNMLINQNADNDEDLRQIRAIKETLNKQLSQKQNNFRDSFFEKKDALKKMTKFNNFDNSQTQTSNYTLKKQQYKNIITSKKNALKPLTKQIVEYNFLSYLKQRKQRKQFLNMLNKDLIQKQDINKIYAFIKGGYSPDPHDLQGNYMSLRLFNQAKQSFLTLDQLYKNIQRSGEVKKYSQTQQEVGSFERTFKQMIYVNQLDGKISPHQLLKLMKKRKIVK